MAQLLIPDYFGHLVFAGMRSLARAGHVCDLAWSYRPLHRYLRGNAVRHMHRITAATDDDAAYVRDIVKLCQEWRYDVILPFGLTAFYALSKHRDAVGEHARMMVPDFEPFMLANDKLKTMTFCQSIGVHCPKVFENYAENDLRSLARELRYPVVIKARSGNGVQRGLRYANNAEELTRYYDEISSFTAPTGASDFSAPIIQEFIPGFIHDACTLTNRGQVVAVLTQVRQLMYPIYGGVGAVNVTTHEPELVKLAVRVLEALRWHGPAQIEFKFDERDGQYKLIELNPKLWGTLDLSLKAGVNFPKLIVDSLLEQRVERFPDYAAGLRYKFWFPQSAVAYAQSFSEFGFRGIWDTRPYTRTFWDIDWRDLLPDVYRVATTGYKLLTGEFRTVHANLATNFVNDPRMTDSASTRPAPQGAAGRPDTLGEY